MATIANSTTTMITVRTIHRKNLLNIHSSEMRIAPPRAFLIVATGMNSQPYPIAWSQSPKYDRRPLHDTPHTWAGLLPGSLGSNLNQLLDCDDRGDSKATGSLPIRHRRAIAPRR